MELSYKEEVGVGVIVIAGLIAFTLGMFWLTGRSISSSNVEAKVFFSDVRGLKEGDPVLVSGVKKGRVGKVDLRRVGHVTVTLELARDVRPHKNASATVAAADFLGAKYVDYAPGSDPDLWPLDREIQGASERQFTDVASQAATSANELIGNAKLLVTKNLGDDIHNTLVATQRGMNALTRATNGPLVKQTNETLAEVRRVMARLDTVLGSSSSAEVTGKRIDTLTTNLAALTTNLAHATASLDTLLGKMARGEGSLGKLATDTLLYKNLNETLAALTALLTDLKERPGRYLTVKVF